MLIELFPTGLFLDKNEELLEEVRNLFVKCEKYSHYTPSNVFTTLKGYNPSKAQLSINLEEFEEGKKLKHFLEKSVFKFLSEMKYDTTYKKVEVCNIWLNTMSKDSNSPNHRHYGYTFSGVYYVDCFTPDDKILFSRPTNFKADIENIQEYIPVNSDAWTIPVSVGDIIIFPSYLEHGVPKIQGESMRRSIAFDVVVYNYR